MHFHLSEMSVNLGRGLRIEFVLIPQGTFVMGSPQDENGRFDDETAHLVNITKPFYLGKYLVTQEQWTRVMRGNPSLSKGKSKPVENVSWEDCQAFFKRLRAVTHRIGYRLPTEAEWEYACRAGTATAYWPGTSLKHRHANFDDRVGTTTPVGRYAPNSFGLYDMHGNVWEWCFDRYGAYPTCAAIDPVGNHRGAFRVLRGGAYANHWAVLRSACRNIVGPPNKNGGTGFRIACSYRDEKSSRAELPRVYLNGLDFTRAWNKTHETSLPASVTPATHVCSNAPRRSRPLKRAQPDLVVGLARGERIELMLIPPGGFWMGSPDDEVGRYECEVRHHVTLSKPFYLARFPVTQGQWKAVMDTNPSYSKGRNKPVENVRWEDCQSFIRRLNVKTGRVFRLPTEAEWEYSCRAGTTTAYSTGTVLRPEDANILSSAIGTTTPVGKYSSNAFGLYDMHGNVWEWCADWFGEYPAAPATDPRGPARGNYRITRGGSFINRACIVRAADRNIIGPPFRNGATGFRLACEP